MFFSRHRGAGPTTDCARPARSRGEAAKQRDVVVVGSEPAPAVLEGRKSLLAFSASHPCPPIPRTAPDCAYGPRPQRSSPGLNGAHVPTQLGDAAAMLRAEQTLHTRCDAIPGAFTTLSWGALAHKVECRSRHFPLPAYKHGWKKSTLTLAMTTP